LRLFVVTEYNEACAVFNQWMCLSMFARHTAQRQCKYLSHCYVADLILKINVIHGSVCIMVHKNLPLLFFLHSSMKHWPILIIFGVQHQEETWCKWL